MSTPEPQPSMSPTHYHLTLARFILHLLLSERFGLTKIGMRRTTHASPEDIAVALHGLTLLGLVRVIPLTDEDPNDDRFYAYRLVDRDVTYEWANDMIRPEHAGDGWMGMPTLSELQVLHDAKKGIDPNKVEVWVHHKGRRNYHEMGKVTLADARELWRTGTLYGKKADMFLDLIEPGPQSIRDAEAALRKHDLVWDQSF